MLRSGADGGARSRQLGIGALLALALTLLNAAKPLHIDDPFIYRVAQRAAEHPLDPYGFDILWLQWPQPVYEELTPPVLPYWWAIGLHLLGEHPVLWKLWLAPFAFLFVGALYALARRLTRDGGAALLLVALTTLGPVVLPGFNLMQDVPAAALGLTGLALALYAGDRGSLRLAAGAGVIAGLAMQTKYVAITFLAAAILHAVTSRHWRLAAATTACAAAVFLAWEAAMTQVYGTGMLQSQLEQTLGWLPRGEMALHFLRLAGGVLPAVAIAGAAALGASRRVTLLLSMAVAAGFALLFVAPIEDPLYVVLGAFVLLVAAACCARALAGSGFTSADRAIDVMLVGWVLLEVVVYFTASPFPAVRRVMGLGLALALLAARQWPGRDRRALVPPAILGVALGAVFWITDLEEARAQRRAIDSALAGLEAGGASGTVWFVGHWGFQFYAEKAGMRAVDPDRSRLAAGDWMVVPLGVDRQDVVPIGQDRWDIALSSDDLAPAATVIENGWLPLTTGFGYYAGSRPLSHRERPRQETRVFRVERDFVAWTAWDGKWIARWVFDSKGRTAAAALPGLAHALGRAPLPDRLDVARALADLGPRAAPAVDALVAALADEDPGVRRWAATALGRVGREAGGAAVPALQALSADADPDVRRASSEALQLLAR